MPIGTAAHALKQQEKHGLHRQLVSAPFTACHTASGRNSKWNVLGAEGAPAT
jgi:hypothetical protein